MTSLRQIEANRRNALKSTGPKTELGKQRSAENAVRHGLTAETVIARLEDPEDYRAFEQAVISNYDAETAVERELCLRLASLLWRLRRATSIETGLFQIQGEIEHEPEEAQLPGPFYDRTVIAVQTSRAACNEDEVGRHALDDINPKGSDRSLGLQNNSCQQVPLMPHRFLRLANLDNGVFERLGRYEAALWRQVRQTLFTLDVLRTRASNMRQAQRQHLWQRTINW